MAPCQRPSCPHLPGTRQPHRPIMSPICIARLRVRPRAGEMGGGGGHACAARTPGGGCTAPVARCGGGQRRQHRRCLGRGLGAQAQQVRPGAGSSRRGDPPRRAGQLRVCARRRGYRRVIGHRSAATDHQTSTHGAQTDGRPVPCRGAAGPRPGHAVWSWSGKRGNDKCARSESAATDYIEGTGLSQ